MDKFPSIPKLSIQQPFSKIIEKATSLFNISTDVKVPALDGEIVYSKNNVCVHQVGGEERVPGYLSLRCSITEMVRVLCKTIHKCRWAILSYIYLRRAFESYVD